jgi:hypothetical protein
VNVPRDEAGYWKENRITTTEMISQFQNYNAVAENIEYLKRE